MKIIKTLTLLLILSCKLSAQVQGIILAAGQSSRMKTGRSKLLEPLCGQPMILFGINLLEGISENNLAVVGWNHQTLKKVIGAHNKNVACILQEEQLGTGHAVLCTRNAWQGDHILVINGDMPLVKQETLKKLIDAHLKSNAALSFVTARDENSETRYGRVIQDGHSIKIIEAKDFNRDPQKYKTINAGIYIFERTFLEKNISTLSNNNNAQEFYLTDLIEYADSQGLIITTIEASFDEIRGVNTLEELLVAETLLRKEILKNHMNNGVRFHDSDITHVDLDVSIGAGSCIASGAQILKGTVIGKNCRIGNNAILNHAQIADNVIVPAFTII